jgi:predicted RNA binding protein YcfA (HicA-like mRNA interferase family)
MGSPVKFSVIVALFKRHGWWLDRVRGSHHLFTNGDQSYTVPVHSNKVKYVYYKQIKKLLGET